jgi:lipoprotein-releasing system ATP-binding protein
MNNSPLLRVKELTRSFRKGGVSFPVLRGISFEMSEGDTLGVVGVSGAGKTTLLQILGTLDRPTGGEVAFRGKDLFSMKDEELARFRRNNVGFVFQSYNLLPEFDAIENLMLPFMISGLAIEEARGKASSLLNNVGLGERGEHRVGELSGGEQQRVAIARALALDPSLILADEPTGNLDRGTGELIVELLQNIVKKNRSTLVLVTHNEKIVSGFSKLIRIDDGRIVEEK